MDAVMKNEFLLYSASEPMTVLRKRFNSGESLYKSVPEKIMTDKAARDVDYVQYVLENAYSGYTYYDKKLFDRAFDGMREIIKKEAELKTERLIDIIADEISFICDGHLSFTTEKYGRGFYTRTRTFVADILAELRDGRYIDTESGAHIEPYGETVALPTIAADGQSAYLIGVMSKNEVSETALIVDGVLKKVPVHEIRSAHREEDILLSEKYCGDIAVISCGTFVGDDEADLQKFERVGEKCRGYCDVIWDLSDNLGGNSAFAERFLTGLNGGCRSGNTVRSLESDLVYAKEYGEIKKVGYRFVDKSGSEYAGEDLFKGILHVIFNNRVASSAELALVYAASLPNTVFYGCNTLGIGKFGDLCIYYLPNSNITLWCPQKVFNM